MSMTESEWLACTDPKVMLEFLGSKASERTLRLFCCVSLRHIWSHLEDERSRKVIDVVERYAEDEATLDDLASTRWAAQEASRAMRHANGAVAAYKACANLSSAALQACRHVVRAAADAAYHQFRLAVEHFPPAYDDTYDKEGAKIAAQAEVVERRFQSDLLREVFSNPFRRPPTLPPTVLVWNDAIVRRIAEGIYQERRMPEGTFDSGRLAVLHDALLDAGCNNEELLTHLLSEGPHVRGCWAIDLILGKE
jgi:hypothetical protein